MLCVHALLQEGRDPSTVVVGLPADHHVQNEKVLVRDLETAMHVAREKKALVTLGITPTHAHTGYGYIEVGEIPVEGKASRAKRFLEKPNRDLAEQFVREKRYFWNSGIFVWDLDSLREAFQTHCGEAWDRISQASPQTLAEVYHGLPPVPFDIAIAEKTKDLWMLPLNAGWSDVGSWGALSELLESKRDATGTIAWEGEIFSVKSENCLVKVPGKKVALVGVENLVVIEDGDKLLILNKEADQHVREIADHEAKIEKSREGQ
jgi:mannose-1-phosphate guanylyltransferase